MSIHNLYYFFPEETIKMCSEYYPSDIVRIIFSFIEPDHFYFERKELSQLFHYPLSSSPTYLFSKYKHILILDFCPLCIINIFAMADHYGTPVFITSYQDHTCEIRKDNFSTRVKKRCQTLLKGSFTCLYDYIYRLVNHYHNLVIIKHLIEKDKTKSLKTILEIEKLEFHRYNSLAYIKEAMDEKNSYLKKLNLCIEKLPWLIFKLLYETYLELYYFIYPQ